MTGDEIIALARANFGEETALTVSEQTVQDFVNSVMHELYTDLPPERMKNRFEETDVVLAGNNRGPIEATWDQIIAVYVNDLPALEVPYHVIQNVDYSDMFLPPVAVYYVDETSVWVRGGGNPVDVSVVHMDPPDEITDFSLEVDAFDELWHGGIALLTTSYMYAQEEDAAQAQHYRTEYSQYLISTLVNLQQEEAA